MRVSGIGRVIFWGGGNLWIGLAVVLLLAVDLSGSMAAEDMEIGGRIVSRLAAVKVVLSDFLERRVGDRVGLLLFGQRPYLVTPLTFLSGTFYLVERLPEPFRRHLDGVVFRVEEFADEDVLKELERQLSMLNEFQAKPGVDGSRLLIRGKAKACLRIDEPANEPC